MVSCEGIASQGALVWLGVNASLQAQQRRGQAGLACTAHSIQLGVAGACVGKSPADVSDMRPLIATTFALQQIALSTMMLVTAADSMSEPRSKRLPSTVADTHHIMSVKEAELGGLVWANPPKQLHPTIVHRQLQGRRSLSEQSSWLEDGRHAETGL